jgi:hypothetical protein
LLPPAVSLALLEQGNDLCVSVLGISFTLAPDGAEFAFLAPTDLDGSGLALGGVAVNLHAGQLLHDGLLEAVGRASVSSRAAVLNINFVGHKK